MLKYITLLFAFAIAGVQAQTTERHPFFKADQGGRLIVPPPVPNPTLTAKLLGPDSILVSWDFKKLPAVSREILYNYAGWSKTVQYFTNLATVPDKGQRIFVLHNGRAGKGHWFWLQGMNRDTTKMYTSEVVQAR